MNASQDINRKIAGAFTYRDILDAKTPREVTEMSMGRIFQHFQGEDSFAVISAMKSNLTKTDNFDRHKELSEVVRARGFGYFELRGVGQDSASGVRNEEWSLVVPKISIQDARQIAAGFDQFSFLYHGPETGPSVVWEVRTSDGGTERVFTEFHPGRMGDFYSEWKGRTFVFESRPTDMGELRARARHKLPGIDT